MRLPTVIPERSLHHLTMVLVTAGAAGLTAQEPLGPGALPVRTPPPVQAEPAVEDPVPVSVESDGTPRWRLVPGQPLRPDAVLRGLTVPEEARLRIDRLGAEDWATRERATAELLTLRVPEECLLAALLDGELDLEQRARLVGVLSRRVLEAPRGAVGIRMRRNLGNEFGVVVEAVIPGMPGEKHLRPGDRIRTIDGRPIRTSDDLTTIVQGRVPGDLLRFTIERRVLDERGAIQLGPNGKPVIEQLDLEFPLGSVEELDRSGGVTVSSRVLNARTRVVDAIRERFGPRTAPLRTEAYVRIERAYVDRDVDSHPSVAWLLRQLAARDLRDPGGDLDIDVRREMDGRLSALLQEVGEAGKPRPELDWLELVVDRYLELMPEG